MGSVTTPATVDAMLRLFVLLVLLLGHHLGTTHAHCHQHGCPLALASYYVSSPDTTLSYISTLFNTSISHILPFNPSLTNTTTTTTLAVNSRFNVPFPCTTCFSTDDDNDSANRFLGHSFTYVFQFNDIYTSIAETTYSNLTTDELMVRFNVYPEDNTPDGASINVTVRCFCGDEDVSKEYGLFLTYPLRDGESLQSVAEAAGVVPQVLERYNVGVDFGGGGGTVVFVPGKDQNGVFPPLALSSGVAKKVAISVPVLAIVMILLLAIYIIVRRRNQVVIDGSENDLSKTSRTISVSVGALPLFRHVAVERSVEFTYKELAQATNNFSTSNKIGEGGFGWVFFAELRGQKAAVKKMKMKASKSFLAELKILMNVNHMNLVHLIGFCIERSLILVYEFIDNGNLSQHLREPGRDPLPWSTRVQIALDSARGIQYIHEHTTPAYIHRDIKSDNILIDKNFRAKVADFGLTKLMELGSETLHTEHAAGTFGYMPTEYARYGSVSPKIDVYAFGVVLFELISARTALVGEIDETAGPQKLSALFDDALRRGNPAQNLSELVDPALGDDYPSESIYKMAMLARACTLDDPKLRPNMRAVYVALETLSTNAENCSTSLFILDEVLMLLASEVPDLGSDVP